MACDIWWSVLLRAAGCISVTVKSKSVLVLVLLIIDTVTAVHTEKQGPSSDFSGHTIVRPRVYHGRSKREISSTKENDFDHEDILTVGFEIDGIERLLDLRLNTDLVPVGYKQRHQNQGAFETHKPAKVELCHYQGSVRDVPGSWVAVSTCRGLRGVIFDGETLHHIQPQDDSLNSSHYLYKQSDLVANNTCGYEGSPHHVVHRKEVNRMSRYKRDAEVIRGPYNANRQSRYVELVLVIDKKEYIALGENLDKVHQHCKDIANIINALYMPLNIFVALVGVEVWSDSDEIMLSTNGDTTLSNFLRYRRERLVKEIPNDNAQLLTRTQFEGGVVGKALKGPICTYEFSGGVSMDHSNVVGLVAATVAHEMGHNFGMEHDSADCNCPEDRCIMAPSSGSSGPVHWSSCSLEYLALAFVHGMDYCLRNKPHKLFDSPICGNGFVEPGEQCDCGLMENCDNPCCNATTCMLHANASCATGDCCDLKTCRPKNAGTECRSAEHECDLPEYCTGQSEYCPADVFKMDGESCNMGKAFCYQGSCRTHNDQCKLLWGPTGTSSDAQCYDMNNKGTKHGNCGYNRIESSYIKCNDQNILCGMLHCKHLNERLEFGMESVAILSHSFINNGGKIIPCRSAIVDLGLNQVDPGLAPDGAKCAPGKMCVNQKCMSVMNLRASVSGDKACPNNCSGNGVCNSLGHCHCDRGFRPPDCTQPGAGGSEDSGPAEDPNARNDFVTALYVIFLGIVPMMVLISFGVWYARNNASRYWKKGAMSAIDRGNNGLSIKTIDRSSPMPRNIETIDSSLSQDPACASLLPKAENDERYNNNLFGQFKGFTIIPIQNQSKLTEPTKPAPSPPTIPTVAIKTNIKPVQRNNTLRSTLSDGMHNINQTSMAPALPPLNPGYTARPLISSPVLAATTCTSMELIGPKVPTRPAPDIPVRSAPEVPATTHPLNSLTLQKLQRPNSTPLTNVVLTEPEKKPEKGSTLNRIASILRPNSGIMRSNSQPPLKDDKNTNSLPRNQHHKANKVIDREMLRNLEISNPIPQTEIEIPTPAIPVISATENEDKHVVMRAQSMRDNKMTPKPVIPTFGSMRQPNFVKRPTSIPASTRPTSPPPGPPKAPSSEKIGESGIKIPGLPGYQNPPVKMVQKSVDNTYDDCMNLVSEPSLTKIMEESPSNDNIYAVIEESIPEKNRKKIEPQTRNVDNEYKSPKPIETSPRSAGSTDSMGLLSEIVSEISNRNFDSIYSTSTLARQKREKEEADRNSEDLGSNSSLGTYVNSSHYKSPGSVYSNSASGKFNSASSTTSSGYLNPSLLNVPQRENKGDCGKSIPVSQKDLKQVDKSKLLSLNSNASNSASNDLSKELGTKSYDKSLVSITNQSTGSIAGNCKKEEKKDGGKIPAKPPLNRTKTPPNITKGSSTKHGSDTNLKPTRQGSDTALKSSKQVSETGLKFAKQGSDTSLKTTRQGSDTSLKSNKQGSNLNKSNGNLNKSNGNLNKSNSSLDKQGSNTNLSIASLKIMPCSVKDSTGKLSNSNSPDLVSSCSNSGQNGTKSPDVLGSNGKISGTSKNGQKTPTLPRSLKTPSTPSKPLNVISKVSSFTDKKKSPTGAVNITKSVSLSAKESANTKVAQLSKLPQKIDVKTGEVVAKSNLVQKAAGNKSNVASLQQKFEVNNKSINSIRTMSALGKKPVVGKTMEVNRSVSAKK